MTLSDLDALASEARNSYAALQESGRRAMEALRTIDPILVEELVATFDAEERAEGWLIGRTIAFGGRSALDLLAQGEREEVLQVLHNLRYGFCA